MAANRNDSIKLKAVRTQSIAPARPSKSVQLIRPEKRNAPVRRRSPHKKKDTEFQQNKIDAKSGNLFLIDDTWTRLNKNTLNAAVEHSKCIQHKSNARIDVDSSSQMVGLDTTTASSDHHQLLTSAHDARTWSVTSPIQFEYRVVEAPNLLHPENDTLIYGHLNSKERLIAKLTPQRRLVVVDETVYSLYGNQIQAYFDHSGIQYEIMTLPMVEEEKSVDLMLQVCTKMKQFNVDRRNEPIIAIGGGVCLDVVGLAATLFRRKTPYIRVPTTTLSYVDASVGAKTGVNFMGSKNRLGAYVPPVAALLDPTFIQTEETRAVASGVAEMAKMAIMKSADLFALLESDAPRLVKEKFQARSDADDVPQHVLRYSIETMLEELAPNLWEKSLDRLVDFGHTIGQELEMHALGTPHELTHGESVAVDMAYSSVLAYVRGHITRNERDRILSMLQRCQVPLYSPIVDREFIDHAISERVQQSMGQRLPLPVGIGKGKLFNDVTNEEFYEALDIWISLVGPEAKQKVASLGKTGEQSVPENDDDFYMGQLVLG